LRTFRDGDALNGGTSQVWDLSAPVHRLRGREFLRVDELPEAPGVGAWVYMPDIEGDDGAARAYYVRLLPLYTIMVKHIHPMLME